MPAYQPTHVVPESGVPAWSEPNPELAPVANLDPRLEVQVVETAGQWAHVQCSNGWTAWVDANRLQAIGAVAPSAPPTAAATGPAAPAPSRAATGAHAVVDPLGLVGAGLTLIGSFLQWFTVAGQDSSAFYFPVAFLWSTDETGKGDVEIVGIGTLVLLLAVAIGVFSFIGNTMARRVAGGVAAFICILYTIELQRLLGDIPDAPGLFSVLGYGMYVSLAGGVVAAVVGTPASRA